MRPTLTEGEILKLALISVILGMVIGIIYDIFRTMRIFRKPQRKGKLSGVFDFIVCFFEDLIFFLTLTVLNVIMLSAYGGGTLRIEVPVIEFTVFLIWHMTVGKLWVKAVYRIRVLLLRAIEFILKPVRSAIAKKQIKQKEKRLDKYNKKEKEKLKQRFRAS